MGRKESNQTKQNSMQWVHATRFNNFDQDNFSLEKNKTNQNKNKQKMITSARW